MGVGRVGVRLVAVRLVWVMGVRPVGVRLMRVMGVRPMRVMGVRIMGVGPMRVVVVRLVTVRTVGVRTVGVRTVSVRHGARWAPGLTAGRVVAASHDCVSAVCGGLPMEAARARGARAGA